MNKDLIKFFSIQRQIFGLCTCCGEIFRLSDAQLYLKKKKPEPDWLDKYDASERRLDNQEDKIAEQEGEIREVAREKGRKKALKATRKIDTIFKPNRLQADDAKVMFHPVDFLVFDGMKVSNDIKRLVLLDREVKRKDELKIQESIQKTVSDKNYDWVTMQIQEDGKIEYK